MGIMYKLYIYAVFEGRRKAAFISVKIVCYRWILGLVTPGSEHLWRDACSVIV